MIGILMKKVTADLAADKQFELIIESNTYMYFTQKQTT